jgi:hypothetical protein
MPKHHAQTPCPNFVLKLSLSMFCFKSEIRVQKCIVHIRGLAMAEADCNPPQTSVAEKIWELWAKMKVKIDTTPLKHKVLEQITEISTTDQMAAASTRLYRCRNHSCCQ